MPDRVKEKLSDLLYEASRKADAERYVFDQIADHLIAHGVTVLPESGIGEMSDGYHTFNELYHHRAVLFSVICNARPDKAWKSKRHNTGDMYDGMFIVGIETDHGQATYHYDIDHYWDMFNVPELEYAPQWDGHTPQEAIARIATGVTAQEMKPIEAFLHPIDTYKGLKAKYLVFKADTGGKVDNCFVLRPDKDPAAVEALRAYARCTDNKTLSTDIYNWVGKGVTVQEWISVKPDGVHDLSPHNFKKVQRLKNVTVEILQCKVCGKVSIGWYRQNNTEEIEQWPAD